MNDIVIKAENLGKKYIIGHQAENGSYTALRDVLMHNARTFWNKTKDMVKGKAVIQGDTMEEVWALKDINFEIKRGEAVGIIGRNGAGKSTLLKVLSRITEPSTGRVTIRGRVASLLEVGTGFHPELTGRENIYLNGTILGMTRAEIKKKFDEIVAFAEIEKFLDTPVKRYSSGMYMRLAFAVAAHLEPEILVVDEVLAVGDAAFQKKCLGKMGEVSKEGRTVLFVSHNMNAISNLCKKSILLRDGQIALNDSTKNVIHYYLQNTSQDKTPRGESILETVSDLPFFVQKVCTSNKNGDILSELSRNQSVVISIFGKILEQRKDYIIALDFKTIDDMLLFRTHSFEQDLSYEILSEKGDFVIKCVLPTNLFPAATYRLGLITAIAGKEEIQNIYPVLEFDIIQTELLGGRFINTKGILTPTCKWIKLNAN